MICVKTRDNKDFQIPLDLARASKTIADLLEDIAPGLSTAEVPVPDEVVPLPNVCGRDMELIIAYWNDSRAAPDWTIYAFAGALSKAELWSLMHAADFLNLVPLLTALTTYVAAQLKDKTIEEMREVLGVTNDFTPEEEAKVMKECAWALR